MIGQSYDGSWLTNAPCLAAILNQAVLSRSQLEAALGFLSENAAHILKLSDFGNIKDYETTNQLVDW